MTVVFRSMLIDTQEVTPDPKVMAKILFDAWKNNTFSGLEGYLGTVILENGSSQEKITQIRALKKALSDLMDKDKVAKKLIGPMEAALVEWAKKYSSEAAASLASKQPKSPGILRRLFGDEKANNAPQQPNIPEDPIIALLKSTVDPNRPLSAVIPKSKVDILFNQVFALEEKKRDEALTKIITAVVELKCSPEVAKEVFDRILGKVPKHRLFTSEAMAKADPKIIVACISSIKAKLNPVNAMGFIMRICKEGQADPAKNLLQNHEIAKKIIELLKSILEVGDITKFTKYKEYPAFYAALDKFETFFSDKQIPTLFPPDQSLDVGIARFEVRQLQSEFTSLKNRLPEPTSTKSEQKSSYAVVGDKTGVGGPTKHKQPAAVASAHTETSQASANRLPYTGRPVPYPPGKKPTVATDIAVDDKDQKKSTVTSPRKG